MTIVIDMNPGEVRTVVGLERPIDSVPLCRVEGSMKYGD